MSDQILESYVDEHGNVSVRISDEFVVLTHDDTELIRAKFDQLQDENAKLRDERDHYKALWEHVHVTDAELRRVRAAWKKDREQIAKLRELVRRLLPCYQWSDCYGGCMAAGSSRCPRPMRLTEEARELGIEVEG